MSDGTVGLAPSETPSADPRADRVGDYVFRRPALLDVALTHKSFAHEHRYPRRDHNERLEFLGDSVLGYVMGRILYETFPQLPEGALSKIKAHFVSTPVLAGKARQLELPPRLLLGSGEEKTGGRDKDSILADAFEAVVAAITLDTDIGSAEKMIRRLYQPDVEGVDLADLSFRDFKTVLQEFAQSLGLPLPQYKVVDEYGPDHQKTFVVELIWNGTAFSYGKGPSKKEAQRRAARKAIDRLRRENPEESIKLPASVSF